MPSVNFRLDMSRLHAQWLVDQKSGFIVPTTRSNRADPRSDYHELLLWDQLKGVMKDPDNNPFPGFQEGPIDFPPTFKVGQKPADLQRGADLGAVRRVEVGQGH